MAGFGKQRLFELLGSSSAGMSLEQRVDVLERQTKVLRELVVSLLVEVEALRSVAVDDAVDNGAGPSSEYGRAYREAALLRHNAAGIIPGPIKLAGLFVDEDRDFGELAMLRRLGYTDEQIEAYRERAEELHTYT